MNKKESEIEFQKLVESAAFFNNQRILRDLVDHLEYRKKIAASLINDPDQAMVETLKDYFNQTNKTIGEILGIKTQDMVFIDPKEYEELIEFKKKIEEGCYAVKEGVTISYLTEREVIKLLHDAHVKADEKVERMRKYCSETSEENDALNATIEKLQTPKKVSFWSSWW